MTIQLGILNMLIKKNFTHLWVVLILLLCAGVLTACEDSEAEPTPQPGLRTWLLVKAPEGPLPINKPINVRSRTEDIAGVSHVELYGIELPSGETNVLIRSDRAPFVQTTFTVSQIFTPLQTGHYVIQVWGYNRRGELAKSDLIGFDIE
jgi:hypothetical protein